MRGQERLHNLAHLRVRQIGALMAENQDNTRSASQEDIWVGPHIVLFTDVLNQRDAIRRLERLPTNPTERVEYIRALKESKGRVEGLRKIIRDFFTSYQQTPTAVPVDRLNDEQRALFEAWKASKTALSFQSFADTVVAFGPIKAVGGILPVDSVYAILAAAGGALLTCLAAGIPIRGGLDLNIALVASENDLYGPAALEAYRLESEVAQYPRIAVGANVVEFLRAAQNSPRRDPLAEIHRAEASTCLEFLAVAHDGVPFVHYLGPHFRQMLGQHAADLFTKGLEFVRQERARFAGSANKKLADRYEVLCSYYERYTSEWTVTA